jgi:ribosomal protein S18 acetylase RimI-like enzyme
MELIFRKATTADIPAIIELCNQCFEENTDVNWASYVFKKTKHDLNQIYLVGVVGDEIVAHTKISIIQTMYSNMGTYAIINHFCTKEKYRRHSIATKMLDEVVKICKDTDCKSIKLWSKNHRLAAHSCYTKYGFEIIDASFFELSI